MSYLFAFLIAIAPQTTPKLGDFNDLIDGVQRSFAKMTDFEADFIQKDQNPLNRNRQATGHLYLMRPRKMRWDYTTPEEQHFISDGKTVYFYVPSDHQVNKEAVKDTFDDRMP